MTTFLIIATATLLILLALRQMEKRMSQIGTTVKFDKLTTFGGPAIHSSMGNLTIASSVIEVRDDCWHGRSCVCFKRKRRVAPTSPYKDLVAPSPTDQKDAA